MVTPMADHDINWVAPSPLWIDRSLDAGVLGRPAILRFDSDSFMEEFLSLVSYDPAQMAGLVAQPEDWRGILPPAKSASLPAMSTPRLPFRLALNRWNRKKKKLPESSGGENGDGSGESAKPLKLYQPAHQRFYLVSASLVCKQVGLPDRKVDRAGQEQVGFVVRRFMPPNPTETPNPGATGTAEYAFVSTPDGSAWKKITGDPVLDVEQLVPGEEILPLFPVDVQGDEVPRRIFSGLIPASRHEAYTGASEREETNGESGGGDGTVGEHDPRMELFRHDVLEPWKSLLERAASVGGGSDAGDILDNFDFSGVSNLSAKQSKAEKAIYKQTREQIQTVSWYVLLDFAVFLERYLEKVWNAILDPSKAGDLDTTSEKPLYDELGGIQVSGSAFRNALLADTSYGTGDIQTSMRAALAEVVQHKSGLEDVDGLYDRSAPDSLWPDFLFPLADPNSAYTPPLPPTATAPPAAITEEDEKQRFKVDHMADLVRQALPVESDARMPAMAAASKSVMDAGNDAWFAIRCVYQRPECFPVRNETVSEPTELFQFAGFFDPDAPVRPIRIGLPLDITAGGLRKHHRNAGIVVSSLLCGQLKRIRKMTFGDLVLSVLPWPFHKDLPDPGGTGPCADSGGSDWGMICSLSIPIVTLCALILLIIMVSLFDLFFKWIPYLFFCFPVPGLKGKK